MESNEQENSERQVISGEMLTHPLFEVSDRPDDASSVTFTPDHPPDHQSSWTAQLADQMFPNVNKVLNNSQDTLNHTIKPAFESIAETAQIATQATHQLMALIEQIRATFCQIPTLVDYIQIISDALCLLYEIIITWINKTFMLIPAHLYRLFSLFKLPQKLIAEIVVKLTFIFSPTEPNQVEGMMNAHGDSMEVMNVLSSVVGMAFLSRNPTKMELSAVNEKMKFNQMLRNETKHITDVLLSFVQNLPEVCKVWAERVLPSRFWYALFAPNSEYYHWMTRIENLKGEEYKEKAHYDVEIQREIRELYQIGLKLAKDCAGAPGMQKVFSLIQAKVKTIEELYDIVDISGGQRVQRIEPFCIYLTGRPGKGKTFLTGMLPCYLAGAPANTPNMSYFRNPGLQHWDGYTGQYAVVLDDFSAVKSNGPMNEYEEFINMISGAPYQLPMADLPEKGRTFKSNVVIVTSNQAFPDDNSVNTKDAIYRRRHVMYDIDVMDEFQNDNGTVDVRRIPEDNSHYSIKKHSDPAKRDGGRWSRPMTFREFLLDVKEKYLQHRRLQTIAMEKNKRMVDNAVDATQMNAHGLLGDSFKETLYNNRFDFFNQSLMLGVGLPVACAAPYVIPKWHEELKLALMHSEEEIGHEKWIAAALLVTGTIAGSVALGWTVLKLSDWLTRKTEITKINQTVFDCMQAHGLDLSDERITAIRNCVFECFKDTCPHEDLRRAVDVAIDQYMVSHGAYNGPRTARTMRPRVIRAPMNVAHAEQTDSNALAVAELVTQSHVKVAFGGDSPVSMQGVFVCGRLLLAPAHFFRDLNGDPREDGTELLITHQEVVFREEFRNKKLARFGEDLALYYCGVNVRVFKDIRKHFITDRDLDNKEKLNAWVFSIRNGRPLVTNTDVTRLEKPMLVVQRNSGQFDQQFISENPGIFYKVAQGWIYNYPSRPGDCGAILIANEKSYARKILGIHVAATNGTLRSCAHLATQEMLNEAIAKFEPQIIHADPRGDISEEPGALQFNAHGNFSHYGKLARKIFSSTKSKIMPSIIHGKIFKPLTGPSVLDPYDPRMNSPTSPLFQGVAKYGNVAPLLNIEKLEEISQHLTHLLDSNWKETMPRKIVDMKIAINGNRHYANAEGIPMDTSAGYPWNQYPKDLKGKADLFEGEPGDLRIKDRELEVAVSARWQLALIGRRYPSLWIDNLKDERRSLEKIALGKTRVFTIPPVDYTIVFRRLCFSFLVNYYNNALNFFSAVGINPESSDWTRLYYQLRTKSPVGFSGDYSSWDGNLAPQAMMEVCHIINRWYDDAPEFQLARRVLFDELIHTPQVVLDSVYFTHLGNPSGCPMTAPLNTIIGAIYLRYTWVSVVPYHLRALPIYEEKIGETIYGDDVNLSVAQDVIPYFNPDAHTDVMSTINCTFTSATDKKEKAKFVPIKELSFLKRGFRKGERGRWLPIMDKTTIQELTNWIRKSDFETPEKMTIDNLNESLRFAFFWGRPFFEELRAKIVSALITGRERIHAWSYFYQDFYENNTDVMHAHSNNFAETVNAKGIISASQRGGSEDNGSEGPISSERTLTRAAISDPPWQLPDLSKRRVWVNTFPWKTADARQTTYASLNAPSEFLVSFLQQAPFERFLMWNGSMTIRIHVNGTRFHAGRLIAFFVPWTTKDNAADWHGINMAAAWSVPNVHLDASSNNTGTLEIPFYNPKSAIFLNGPADTTVIDHTGSFFIQVLSPLTASTGTATQIDVTVWVEFNTDSNFRIPVHSAAPSRTIFNRWHEEEIQKYASAYANADGLEFETHMNAHGNSITTTNNIDNYGSIEGGAVPMNVTGDSIGNGNSATLPMDKPARPWNPQAMYRKGFQHLASTNTPELTTRMDLHTANLSLSLDEMFGTKTDEMVLKEILTRPTYAGAVTWNAADPSATALISRWLGPGASLFQNASQSQITLTEDAQINITGWEYAVLPFQFWRGSLKIRLDVVATQMHTGRLFLALNYGAPPDSETSLRDATSQYGVEIDLSNECRTFEFNIPYNSTTPWMRVCRGPKLSAYEYSGSWYTRYFLGSWSLRVLNQLVAPDNVSSSVEILFSVAGGDDFEVYYPSPGNELFVPYGYIFATNNVHATVPEEKKKRYRMRIEPIPEESCMHAHGDNGEAGTDAVDVPTPVQSEQTTGIVVAPPAAKLGDVHYHFGPRAAIRHLGELIKRYTAYSYAPITQSVSSGAVVVNYRDQSLNTATDNAYTTAGFTIISNGGGGAQPTVGASYVMFVAMPVAPFTADVSEIASYQPADARSAMSYFGMMFRFWRGSMRYKAIWDGVTDYKGMTLDFSTTGAVYLPGVAYNTVGGVNWAATAAHYSNCMMQSSNTPITTGAGPTARTTKQIGYSSSLAVDVNTANARYNDIEIPFTTHYNVLPTNNWLPSSYASYNDTMSGTVLWMARFFYPGDDAATTALQTKGLIGFPIFYKAAGDDFRFGTYLGPPQLTIRAMLQTDAVPPTTPLFYTSPFDTWFISTPTLENAPEDQVARASSPANSDMTESILVEAMQEIQKRRNTKVMHAHAKISLNVDDVTEFQEFGKPLTLTEMGKDEEYDLSDELLEEFRKRTEDSVMPQVGNWQVMESRAAVFAHGHACFHIPYFAMRRILALKDVWSHAENIPKYARNSLLMGSLMIDFMLSDIACDGKSLQEMIKMLEKQFELDINIQIRRRASSGKLEVKAALGGSMKNTALGYICSYWTEVPKDKESLAMEMAMTRIYAKLYRATLDYMYVTSQGREYYYNETLREGMCLECRAIYGTDDTLVRVDRESAAKTGLTSKVAFRDILDPVGTDIDEERTEYTLMHAHGDLHPDEPENESEKRRLEYVDLIHENYDDTRKQMRYSNYPARCLLNELCQKFTDTLKECETPLDEGMWSVKITYQSEFVRDPIEHVTAKLGKKKAVEATSLLIVINLWRSLFELSGETEQLGEAASEGKAQSIAVSSPEPPRNKPNPFMVVAIDGPVPPIQITRTAFEDLMRIALNPAEQYTTDLRLLQSEFNKIGLALEWTVFESDLLDQKGWTIQFMVLPSLKIELTTHEERKHVEWIKNTITSHELAHVEHFTFGGRATNARFDGMLRIFLARFYAEKTVFFENFSNGIRTSFIDQTRGL